MRERDLRLRAKFGRCGTAAVLASIVVVMASLPNVGAEDNRFSGVLIRSSSSWGGVRIPVPRGFRICDDDSTRARLQDLNSKKETEILGEWRKSEADALWWGNVLQLKSARGKRVSLSEFQELCGQLHATILFRSSIQENAKKDGNEMAASIIGTSRMLPVHLKDMACMGFTQIEKGEADGKTIYYVNSQAMALVRFTLFTLNVTCIVKDEKNVDKAVDDTRASLKEWLDDIESANPGASFSFGTDSIDHLSALPNSARVGDGDASHRRSNKNRFHNRDVGQDKDEDKGPGVWISALVCGVSGGVAGLISALFKSRKWQH